MRGIARSPPVSASGLDRRSGHPHQPTRANAARQNGVAACKRAGRREKRGQFSVDGLLLPRRDDAAARTV
ncbi:MAG: hypothetical protein MJE77_19640 [Proteobacteria bacterium]|nr:hypothetical protein [Pseudomonadota bacterium]